MGEAGAAHQQGELGKTPIAHLLVYALDRQLTGELFLEGSPGDTVVSFVRGVPRKIRAGDRHLLLGRMLVDLGAISEKTLADALDTRGLLGDALLLAGRVERDLLESTAARQFAERAAHLFELPRSTKFRYVEGSATLASWGEACIADPLRLLATGVQRHGSTACANALAAIRSPLRVHPATPIERFGFDADERLLVDHMAAHGSSLEELVGFDLLPAVAVERLVYLLLIVRAFASESGSVLPLCCEVADSSQRTPLSSRPVAKVQLRSNFVRAGAAVPDLPGDGERAAVSVRNKKKGPVTPVGPQSSVGRVPDAPPSSSAARIPDAPVSSRGAAPPSSAVAAPPSSAVVSSAPVASGERVRSPLPPRPVAAVTRKRTDEELADLSDAGEWESASIRPGADARATPIMGAMATDAFAHELSRDERPTPVPPSPVTMGAVAREKIAARDVDGALEAANDALRADPDNIETRALVAWVRAHMQGADLASIADELDELLAARDLVEARYYRAVLRARLGDHAGSMHDLRRVLDAAPGHEEATRELAVLVARAG
ncbi:MAG TPA: hypothetical protein VGM56_12310 [Byssovorax sp.]